MKTLRLLLGCAAAAVVPCLAAAGQGPTAAPLTVDEKMALLGEAERAVVPRGGRWVWMYRPWNHPPTDEVIVWDSSLPDQGPGVDRIEVPCWLKQTVSVRAEGLVDGRGELYSGPLLAKVSPAAKILGPYPEGFVCCLDGAFRVDFLAEVLQFAEDASVHVGVHYRVPYVRLVLADRLWPSNPDRSPDYPTEDVTVMGNSVWFRPVALDGQCEFSEVQRFLGADTQELRVDARLVLPSGRPAARLPMQFEWHFMDAPPDLPEQDATHDMETSLQGVAQDSIQVPATLLKGWVVIKCHTNGKEYSTLVQRQFDFGKAGP